MTIVHAVGGETSINEIVDRCGDRLNASEVRMEPRHAVSYSTVLLQDAQKGRPARPQRVKARGVPFGYVEGLNDARTLLADFFSILLLPIRPRPPIGAPVRTPIGTWPHIVGVDTGGYVFRFNPHA
jgi:hypothetical protein